MTEANRDGRYIGTTDLPLSPEGMTALVSLRAHYDYPPAARLYSSPLMRCKQTLSVLYHGREVTEVEGLAECDFGEWENKSAGELRNDPEFVRWTRGETQEIPGGENAADFQMRVMNAFEKLVQDVMRAGDSDTVVCTHGGVIMMILQAYGLPQLPVSECTAQPGEGFTLRVTPSVWMREPKAEVLCIIPWEKEEE